MLTTINFTSTFNQKTRSRHNSAYNTAIQSSSSGWLPAIPNLTWTRLNWRGRALSTTSQRFPSAVVLWHLVVPRSSDWTPSVFSSPVNAESIPWQACHRGQCQMILSASTTAPRRSLDDNSVATLIHMFVASQVDYCSSLLIGVPKKTTNKLQRVLNAAAQIVSNTCKYDRGLSSSGNANFTCWTLTTVCVQVYKCLHNMAPGYLSALCQPVSRVPGRSHVSSAGRGKLNLLCVNLSMYGGRAFAYAGPTCWNSLPDTLKNINLSLQTFKHHLKTFLFSSY